MNQRIHDINTEEARIFDEIMSRNGDNEALNKMTSAQQRQHDKEMGLLRRKMQELDKERRELLKLEPR